MYDMIHERRPDDQDIADNMRKIELALHRGEDEISEAMEAIEEDLEDAEDGHFDEQDDGNQYDGHDDENQYDDQEAEGYDFENGHMCPSCEHPWDYCVCEENQVY